MPGWLHLARRHRWSREARPDRPNATCARDHTPDRSGADRRRDRVSQLFNPRSNTIALVSVRGIPLLLLGLLGVPYVYQRSPYATGAGRVVSQVVPFSHEHHVGGLGLDCRYCHATAEQHAFAGMPATQICMNCHGQLWTNAAMLEPVRESWRLGQPLHWTRVHDMPDFVYFDHSIHVNKGVGCVTCHGRVDRMPLVHKAEPMTMQWCLDCHRDPAPNLRPPDAIFDMTWTQPAERGQLAERLMRAYGIRTHGLTDCTICHR